jgi:hypothetical protein
MLLCRAAIAVASLLLLVAWSGSTEAAEMPPADVIVTVTGEPAHSFEEAMDDALRKAVETGAGKDVFSDTRIADFALMHDTIVSRAAGYVRRFDILERKEEAGAYSVKIRATVALGKIKDDWGAIQVIIQREGRPNILVVCTEEIMHYLTGQPLPGTGNIAESRLRNLFLRTEKGDKLFDLIDDETLAKKVGRAVTREMLRRDENMAVAVANQAGADFLVIVTAKGRARQETIYNMVAWIVDADLRVKVTAADTALTVADENVRQRRPSEDPTTAAGDAFEIAAKQVWPRLLKNILFDWGEKQLDGRKIECMGRRIPTDVHDDIVRGLEKTEGVKQVRTQSHDEMLSIDWVFTRKPRDLARAIVEASGKKVRIVAESPGRREYEMAPVPPPVPSPPPPPPPVQPPDRPTSPVPDTPMTTVRPPPASLEPQGGIAAETQGGQSNDTGPISTLRRVAALLDNPPPWLLPAVISAVAVVGAFVGGILVARRKGRSQRP